MQTRLLSALALAVLAVPLVLSRSAVAQTAPVAQGEDQTIPPVNVPDSQPAAAERKPLMLGLDYVGLAKPLDDAKINIYGFVAGSYTFDWGQPPGDNITGRVFDVQHDDLELEQADIQVERLIDIASVAETKTVDVGGKVELIYGQDARFIHANGLNFYGGNAPQLDPKNQFDLVQAYVDVGVPVGNGLNIRVGKFVTLLGFEVINPTANPFFSHSYSFGYAIAFTHVGVLGTYKIDDHFTLDLGVTRGWDQSLEDNNGRSIDVMSRLTWAVDDKTTAYFTTTIGPEAAGDSSGWWYSLNGIFSRKVTDELTLSADTVYTYYEAGSNFDSSQQWYGVAGYASYKINDYVTANLRGEWFDDNDGYRFGSVPNQVYEATAGVTVHPFPADKFGQNLSFRPEIRYDYSNKAFFDAGTDHDQWTLAVDAIYQF